MTLDDKINELKQKYNIIEVVNLDEWNEKFNQGRNWLEHTCRRLHKDSFADNERIIFTHLKDFYADNADQVGIILRNLQVILNV